MVHDWGEDSERGPSAAHPRTPTPQHAHATVVVAAAATVAATGATAVAVAPPLLPLLSLLPPSLLPSLCH